MQPLTRKARTRITTSKLHLKVFAGMTVLLAAKYEVSGAGFQVSGVIQIPGFGFQVLGREVLELKPEH